jgi:hypothetical protein
METDRNSRHRGSHALTEHPGRGGVGSKSLGCLVGDPQRHAIFLNAKQKGNGTSG